MLCSPFPAADTCFRQVCCRLCDKSTVAFKNTVRCYKATYMERLFLEELLCLISFVAVCGAVDVTLTVNVLPGTRECFTQELPANSQYAVEYQVRLFYCL